MGRVIEMEAIYRDGVFAPMKLPQLRENQRVMLTVRVTTDEDAEVLLTAWRQVYKGFSDADLAEIETIALDREHFTDVR